MKRASTKADIYLHSAIALIVIGVLFSQSAFAAAHRVSVKAPFFDKLAMASYDAASDGVVPCSSDGSNPSKRSPHSGHSSGCCILCEFKTDLLRAGAFFKLVKAIDILVPTSDRRYKRQAEDLLKIPDGNGVKFERAARAPPAISVLFLI